MARMTAEQAFRELHSTACVGVAYQKVPCARWWSVYVEGNYYASGPSRSKAFTNALRTYSKAQEEEEHYEP
jgi:hypothetical protein